MLPPITKHVFADRRFVLDLKPYLQQLQAGISLVAASYSAPAGITCADGGVASPFARPKIGGGTAGQTYDIGCRFTFSDGQVDDRTLRVRVAAQLYEPGADGVFLDPDAIVVYGLDWSAVAAELGAGVAVASHLWPPAVDITISNQSLSGNVSRARFSAAALGADIIVENRATFDNGDLDARNIKFLSRSL